MGIDGVLEPNNGKTDDITDLYFLADAFLKSEKISESDAALWGGIGQHFLWWYRWVEEWKEVINYRWMEMVSIAGEEGNQQEAVQVQTERTAASTSQ